MATKRKRNSEPKKIAPNDARAVTPERRPTPRKRTDVPAKPARIEPEKKLSRNKVEKKATRIESEKKPIRVEAGAKVRRVELEKKLAPIELEEKSDCDESQKDAARSDAKKASRKPKKQRRRWPFVVTGIILVVVMVVVAVFSWDRWLRYDDAAEFLGEWQTPGSSAVVVIDDSSIKLTQEVAYSYSLDTNAKTISFTFGAMEGAGRYRFSLDRSQLVITDGKDYSWFSTLTDDIGWMAEQAFESLQGNAPDEVAASDGVTVLDRMSHDTSASPSDVSQ